MSQSQQTGLSSRPSSGRASAIEEQPAAPINTITAAGNAGDAAGTASGAGSSYTRRSRRAEANTAFVSAARLV